MKAFEEPLPQIVVDEEKLGQIVMNLLSNAARFTASGSIQVRGATKDGVIRIAVADTGIGIAAEKLERIFEEFEQAKREQHARARRHGSGLTIARRLARLMGGDIEVESRVGAGSTFTLTLPLRYVPPHA